MRETLYVGLLMGLAHAICETTFLTFYGLKMSALDLGLVVGVSLLAGIAIGIVAGGIALIPPVRRGLATLQIRQAAWMFAVAVYAAIFLGIVARWSGSLGPLEAVLWASPVLAVAATLVVRYRGRARVLFWAGVAVAAAFCALQLVHGGLAGIPEEKRLGFVASMAAAVAFCCLGLFWAARTSSRGLRLEPIGKFARFAMIAGLAWTGAVTLAGSQRAPWLMRDQSTEKVVTVPLPNVLLVVLDTVRTDHLELFGYGRETMPNLTRFARNECQVAMPMLTTAPWTAPSHASMFTGLYSSAHGLHLPFVHEDRPDIYAHPMRQDVPTLAEYLDDQGYQTGAIAANYGSMAVEGLLRGFARQDIVPGPSFLAASVAWVDRAQYGDAPPAGTLVRRALPSSLGHKSLLFGRREPPYRRASEITERARRWIDRKAEKPFFLFLNYFDAHQPYLPVAEDDERFAARPEGEEWKDFPTERFNAARKMRAGFSPSERDFLVGQYDAELAGLDRAIGRLLEHLRQSGLYDDTLILITTDHGESFFEHGLVEHGNALYQSETGGFLLVKTPNGAKAVEASPYMQFVDLFPTVAELVGEPPPEGLQGSAWGRGRDYALSEVYCRVCGAGRDDGQWPELFRREQVAVVSGGYKLIRSSGAPDEIYDLRTDPLETRPLDGAPPKLTPVFEKALAEHSRPFVHEQLSNRQPSEESEASKNKLRSLGYLN